MARPKYCKSCHRADCGNGSGWKWSENWTDEFLDITNKNIRLFKGGIKKVKACKLCRKTLNLKEKKGE